MQSQTVLCYIYIYDIVNFHIENFLCQENSKF